MFHRINIVLLEVQPLTTMLQELNSRNCSILINGSGFGVRREPY